MRRIIYRWFWSWDYEKEEKWLNEMSLKGFQLVSVNLCRYVFEERSDVQYIYRLEFLKDLPSNVESRAYIGFLEDTGVEYIGSFGRWVYFRKNAAYGEFKIYSDIDSKIRHYKRLNNLFLAILPANLCPAIINFYSYFNSSRTSVNLQAGCVSFLVSALIGVGIFKVSRKIKMLKKERIITE
ncbi:DUF2812 domain-containing protein [Fervidicella metallireducens]|nr:DUF2812 domain-containing protein [Fervidicella metallireducens]